MFLSKSVLLKAFRALAQLDGGNVQQGLTVKVSVIRYALAIDALLKRDGLSRFDTRDIVQKKRFYEEVSHVVHVCDGFYTNNFIALKEDDGSCCSNSNFIAGGPVLKSKTSDKTFSYPSNCGAEREVLEVRNEQVWFHPQAFRNLQKYLFTSKLKVALCLWLNRQNSDFGTIDRLDEDMRKELLGRYSNNLMQVISTTREEVMRFVGTEDVLMEKVCRFNFEDFNNAEHSDRKTLLPHQWIVYGPPGTGKSRGIEEMVKDYPDRVIRTTFHPDSDYSTFVGAYKPTMVDDPYETIVQVNKIVRDREGKDSVQSELKPVRQRHIAYLFVEQAFTKAYVKAWRTWAERPSGGVAESVYLIIEEINRGNCAQVFGDIFQLLDRENGFSQYPIQADEDLRQHLAKEFESLDFGEKFEKVRLGRELVLPSNLYIWATMNTSDQSLFPMDSAFKRRWNWQYVPIKDAAKNWQIVFSVEEGGKVERKTYSWWDFLCRINDVIERLTSSEDKQMGYFFVKPINGEIDEKLLVNKVFFYLWNDVFRDVSDVEELEVMIDGHTQNLKFHHFFNVLDGKEDEASINTHILRDFMDKLMGSTSPAVE